MCLRNVLKNVVVCESQILVAAVQYIRVCAGLVCGTPYLEEFNPS